MRLVQRVWVNVPDEVKVLQRTGHLLTFLLQLWRTELKLWGMRDPTTLLPQELQRMVHQLKHAQEVQLARLVHIPRTQLENMQMKATATVMICEFTYCK